ncbi:MAG: glycoside hydrolase family 26 protein, partial [Rikenella sp.]|nr:glycoside hydrolase family 26 protein [Rikenella sp.]
AGGIVAVMWHWRDPSKRSSSFSPTPDEYGQQALFDLSELVAGKHADGTYVYATETEEYKNLMEDIAAAKAELQTLAEAGIPVLWRPLHEASGGWFWWGAKGPDACKALWMLLRREMADLHNLVWVWTVQTHASFGAEVQWYPGQEQVDIVGVDIYEETHGSFAEAFKYAAEVSGSKKVLTLAECGAMPDPDKMYAEGATWAYCMPWYGDHTQSDVYNGADYWKKMMNDGRVIVR